MEFLDKLDVPFFKVGSGDTNNLPFLTRSAKKGRPMIVSSGMQSMDTMRKVVIMSSIYLPKSNVCEVLGMCRGIFCGKDRC